ncbi:MAG: YggU family protein [Magnetococcales bacterium]|nr:YggU family protein [Magnetococcales bacterium]
MSNAATSWWRTEQGDLLLEIHVAPRASRETILGLRHGRLGVALTAPPVEGAANKALIAYLAKQLGIAKSAVIIVQGEQGRDKRVRLQQVAPQRFTQFCRTWQLPDGP